MPEDNGNLPMEEFLDDFFAESDEHLTMIRGKLMSLEGLFAEKKLDTTLLNDLFRSFHTLKGLAGMVGLKEAETIAHHMEHYLKALLQGQVPPTSEGMAALIKGTRTLESIIAARRENSAFPDIEAVVQSFREQAKEGPMGSGEVEAPLPYETPRDNVEGPKKAAEEVKGKTKPIWRFLFTPTQVLSQKGINVNCIRERLDKIGELLQSTPHVTPDGKVFFEFLVATGQDKAFFSSWSEEGITIESYENTIDSEIPNEKEMDRSDVKIESDEITHLASVTPSNVVRVNLTRLEELMKRVGDLVISRSRLENQISHLEKILPSFELDPLQEIHLVMSRQLRDLREGVMRLRMVPMGDIFTRMQFVIHDLVSKDRKEISLVMIGKDTEIDKFVVERMMDPLLHLVRNAVTHGFETEEERVEAGKAVKGTIFLRALTEGDAVIIEVEDDGRGIDSEAVAERAMGLGLLEKNSSLDMESVLRLICQPAFSTKKEADLGSGRGIGMTVVSQSVQELGGSLSMHTSPGKGTCFRIRLPLTLAIVDALIVGIGDQIFAVPQPSVREVIDFQAGAVTEMENNEILPYRGGVLPLVRLANLFGLESKAKKTQVALVIGEGLRAAGITVDRVVSKREIVVRTLDDPLVMVPGISGATELGDGRAVMILDAVKLIEAAQKLMRRK